MKPYLPPLLVAIGGALGALARYGLGGWVQQQVRHSFPYGTLIVNLLGCLLMGVLMHWIDRNIVRSEFRLFFGIGVLGGFTTFSSFSWEALHLFQQRSMAGGLLYVGASLLGCLAMVTTGYTVAQTIWK